MVERTAVFPAGQHSLYAEIVILRLFVPAICCLFPGK